MMHTCELFDRYRDGELGSSERDEFEAHLSGCESCGSRMSLLNNLVCVLRQERIPTVDLAEQITRKAFHPSRSWDALMAAWLKPGFAMAAVVLVLAVVSFTWLVPAGQQIATYSEYEKLLNDADSSNLAGKLLVHNDNELVLRLEEEGNSQ